MDSLVTKTVAAGIVSWSNRRFPERPDRLIRAGLEALRWGPGPVGALPMAAARDPKRVAHVDDSGAVTYEALHPRSHALARSLAHRGVGPGSRVGLLQRNHRGFVESLVAAALCGADVVLLNTGFSSPQLLDVIDREGISTVLHDDEFAAALAGSAAALLDEQACQDLAAGRYHVRASTVGRNPGRLIILTSGTTGRPKGATRSSAGGIDVAAGLLSRLPLRAGDTQVIAAPVFHGWGLTHLLLGMGRSTTTVLSRHFDAEDTLRSVAEHRADVLVVVPVMLQRILALGADALLRHDVTGLRVIASSGSALGPSLASATLDRFGPVLFNIYGSTEVSIGTVATPSHLRRSPACAGKAAFGAKVAVLDADGRRVPPGQTGRVFVGNRNRFDGYTDGGSKEKRDGLLSTGDLGHSDPAGLLYIDGREDDMIVSGGENVYPSEVEDLLARHPEVAEVAVVGVDDQDFGQALAAFVVVVPGATVTEQELQDLVRQQLARFKVPRRVEFRERLPRNSTGKVLRRELVR
jgi:fatty-acyl-CoA synthase